MSKILCATDLATGSAQLLGVAAAFARAFRTSLDVLHVLEPPSALATDIGVSLVAGLREAAEKQLESALSPLARSGVAVSGWVEIGRADEVILDTARAMKPVLLVAGTHGRGRIVRALVGSVAERLMRKAPCPLIAIPPGAGGPLEDWGFGGRPLRVTAGIDPSGPVALERLLAWLEHLRGLTPCELTFLHVYWPPRESRRLGLPLGGADDDGGEIARVLEREVRASLKGRCENAVVDVKIRPGWDEPQRVLAEEAEKSAADLLLLGTSAGGGASTAIGAVREGRVPVLCIPATEGANAATKPSQLGERKGNQSNQSAVVFTDFSPLADTALSEAVWLLRGRGRLTICHVLCRDAGDEGALEAASRRLAALAEAVAKGPSLEVNTLIHDCTSVREGITQAIERIGPDIVVMASHGAGGPQSTVLGSIAETVVRRAPVPVVIVPPRPEDKSKFQTAGHAA